MTRIEIPNSTERRRSSRGAGRWLTAMIGLALAGAAVWTWLTLAWAYSDGERAGILQKFSHKGWLCKTYEGEIAMVYGGGQYLATPQMWQFSVRDGQVAADMNKAVGHRVQLHYTEHPGVPTSCFAETRYFVDRVALADDQPSRTPSTSSPSQLPDVRPGATLPAPPPASSP